jgi:phospholipase/carboxylesterase
MSIIHTIENTSYAGVPLQSAERALIMVHGRGASAASILTLADHLAVSDFALIAPNATGGTWYPYSFIAPEAQNEPYLTSALTLLSDIVAHLKSKGFDSRHIYFVGFSQGACLTSEYLARHAEPFGGAFIFTGGVIGEVIRKERYAGHFEGTPIFIGSSNPDFHVPVERVYATANILRDLGATVTEKIYPNMPHTIIPDEIDEANRILNLAVS